MTQTLRPAFADRPRPLLSYGIPFPDAAAHHVTDLFQASRIYILCSESLARNTDALDRLTTALGQDKVVGTRIGMKSHTMWSEVLEIVHEAKAAEADLLITLGGGSLTDAAKVIALALSNDALTPHALLTLTTTPPPDTPSPNPNIHTPTIPILSIPTSLSAGEYSPFAGATNDTSSTSAPQKHSFQSPTRGPELIILDPTLTRTTPARIWLGTGIRAIDHCVETYCAMKGMTSETDQLALHALGLLVPGLLRCKIDGEGETGLGARLDCALGSVDAMAACSRGRVQLGGSHGIGHQLGPLGVPHGETSCILLPAVCKYNAKKKANNERQDRLRGFLLRQEGVMEVVKRWYPGKDTNGGVEEADLGDVLDVIIRELGLPRTLKEVGVGRDKLDGLAENSLRDRWCRTNPVPLVEKEQVLEILEMVVE
ncbi:putative Fe-containing alcohol dehydrogenase [Aspergillus sclerotioniger CBS 115572]|uniref:Putative Fe-containing alcohol dehydrogenase n=1 Tax=Aspergillus sclerotioniger CBS 115572 TaxID=1450535 RepID=A0A317VTS7_9EURO|nr:putative Fe-containing alcohol dehydrogenase [Aspergillus sclerotioniger CBS 115572]PWY76427.1 putative Fe-containing alcohol dehydrogenase [Aspergillus sclerotioniger CBS 115572]